MLGSGRKEGNYETMLNILQYKEKGLKVGVQAKRGGSRECKALEAGDLDSLSPLPLSHLLRTIIYHRPNFLICDTRTVLVNLLHNMILSCWDKKTYQVYHLMVPTTETKVKNKTHFINNKSDGF